MTQPVENLIAKFIANRVGRDYEAIDVQLACSLLDYLKEEGWEVREVAPEVEVTYDSSSLHVEAPERPPERRRSGAKNVSDPIYQNAFIEGARAAMGQPSIQEAEALLGHTVTLSFNVDWRPATGVLTQVVNDPAGPAQLFLDNYKERSYPLNAIQEIVKVR